MFHIIFILSNRASKGHDKHPQIVDEHDIIHPVAVSLPNAGGEAKRKELMKNEGRKPFVVAAPNAALKSSSSIRSPPQNLLGGQEPVSLDSISWKEREEPGAPSPWASMRGVASSPSSSTCSACNLSPSSSSHADSSSHALSFLRSATAPTSPIRLASRQVVLNAFLFAKREKGIKGNKEQIL